ncbi:MAG: phosphonate C-P lyase system protein PhnG [Acidaminococcaceae bacterium]
MDRKRRTRILIEDPSGLARKLSEEIEGKYDVKIIEEPNSGLVMLKMRENSKRALFYLGEVIVVEAKVEVEGKLGIGIVTGNNEELAYWLAVIDAAFNAELAETKTWEELLQQEAEELYASLAEESERILRTKVNFETMSV